jgi:hypothetical protein
MFGSDMLEVALGLVFVYLLMSMVCSAIREGLESMLQQRAITLGAPFWFDLLNRFMVARSTVKPDEKEKEGKGTKP